MKKLLSFVVGICLLATSALAAEMTKEPIRIGSIGPYESEAFFMRPYDNGAMLAINEINAKGGVLGRPLELLRRDSKMQPGESVRLAEELRFRDHADFLMSTDSSSAVLALSEWSDKNKVPFVITGAEADSIVWGPVHDYQIRVDWSAFAWMSGIVEKASMLFGDRLKDKKWASVSPNYEFGRSLVAATKKVAMDKGLHASWTVEQWPTMGKIDAGATVAALKQANPDIIFCALFDKDLVRFIREAKKRGLITKDRIIIAPMLAFPDHLNMLQKELPIGWVSLGFPYNDIHTQSFETFLQSYRAAYKVDPWTYSIGGYNGVKAIAAMIEKAGSVDPEKIKTVLDNLRFDTITGPQTIRPLDHQATIPFWVGLSGFVDGQPSLVNWTEMNTVDHLPSDAWIKSQQDGKTAK